MAIFGQFLFPVNATPKQRWTLLVTYWLILLLGIALPFGYIHELQVSIRQVLLSSSNTTTTATASPEAATTTASPAPTYLLLLLHILHGIWNCPLLLCLWKKTYVSNYNRPLRSFATIVYPLCHVVDTILWISAIDFGSTYVAKTLLQSTNLVIQISCGFVCVSCVIACHRITLEQWYLPQHHYPPDTDPIVKQTVIRFVLTACCGTFIMTCNRILHVHANYSSTHDDTSLVVIVLVKYIFDTIIASTIHIPNPWDKNDNSYARNKRYMEGK